MVKRSKRGRGDEAKLITKPPCFLAYYPGEQYFYCDRSDPGTIFADVRATLGIRPKWGEGGVSTLHYFNELGLGERLFVPKWSSPDLTSHCPGLLWNAFSNVTFMHCIYSMQN